MGSFYLRNGTSAADAGGRDRGWRRCCRCCTLALRNGTRPITLLYGVTRDSDLVKTGRWMRLSISFPATAGCRSLPMNRAPARSAGLSPGILMTRCLTMAMSTHLSVQPAADSVNAVSGALRSRN